MRFSHLLQPATTTSSVLLTDTQLPPACTLHVNEPASTACNDEPATTVCNDEPAVPTSSPSPCDRSEIALSSSPSTCLLREAPYETILVALAMQTQALPQFSDYKVVSDGAAEETGSFKDATKIDKTSKTLVELITTLIRAYQEYKTNGTLITLKIDLGHELQQLLEIVKEYFTKSNLVRNNQI
ncbi:unnamed protein product [Plutella xylostella]|uniref:(diamondback moth) hypothetical protein n=1 Tax=Plutella xylostella TaxID=51655 RepID=A0A8S4FN82_PLUXY|nr:unnamed protein product [Plutella xylostella]